MKLKAFKAAFPYTLPILTGFLFLGFAYGIYMNANGFSFVYPLLTSLLVYGGSLEFVTVEMLLSPFAPMQVLIMTLLIQARHIFYGISMLERYKGLGCVMNLFPSTIQRISLMMLIKDGLCFLLHC